jgi:hypothetical protein
LHGARIPFHCGHETGDALRVVRELNAKGINATLDHLGEHTNTPEEAQQATDDIFATLDALGADPSLKGNVSIKLTQIGLGLDESLCAENLERILARAKQNKTFIRVDIEDTPYTDKTINLYYAMREKGYENVGMAVQSYLYRAEADTRRMMQDATRIRLVKGAYKEPPDKAFPKKADVDANFDLLTKILIDTSLAKSPCSAMTGACRPSLPLPRTMTSALPLQNPMPKKWVCRRVAWNSKCCTAFAAICRKTLRRKATPCVCMCPLARIGIHTSCAVWPNAPRTSGSLFRISLGDKFWNQGATCREVVCSQMNESALV